MLTCPNFTNNPLTGSQYFFKGVCLIWHPKLRPFIFVPLIINIVLFVVLTSLALQYLGEASEFFREWMPDMLKPLIWLVWFVLGSLALIVYGYSFNIITNLIAAPFYGVLAERAELLICGVEPPKEDLWQMVLRVFLRELRKILYFLSRGLLITMIVILIGTIPIIQFIAPLIGLAWAAWVMTIQYVDYAADNHALPFGDLRRKLWKKCFSSFGFGAAVMGTTIIPIINIFVMPAAVVGGTLFWVHELKLCDQVNSPECLNEMGHPQELKQN